MKAIKIYLFFTFSLICLSSNAHMTIAGFEDTLNFSDKKRLDTFIFQHKSKGYHKCYYIPHEDTVACEKSTLEKVYFK